MEAKPFYVVFYKVGLHKTLYEDFLYIDPKDKQLKITNTGSHDFQKQFFDSDQFKLVLNKIDKKVFPLNPYK